MSEIYEECMQACEAIQREMKPAVKQIIMRSEAFKNLTQETMQMTTFPTDGRPLGIGLLQIYSYAGYIDVIVSDVIPWTWVAMNEDGVPVEHGERVT